MFRQNRTLKKRNQLWELVLTPREAIIVGRSFWPPINERRASCAPPSTASCLRPTFTRFTIRLNRGRAQVVAPSLNLLECGGKRSATPLSSGSQGSRITWRTGGSHQVGKSAVAPSLCRRSPKSVRKRCRRRDFRQRLADDDLRNPADAWKEIIVLKSAR